MNCLDCQLDGLDRPAVATCHRCGAGVCVEHAAVTEHYLHTRGPISIPRRSVHPARQIECLVCHRAELELTEPWGSSRHRHHETTATRT